MHCDFKRALRGSDIKSHRSSSPSCGYEQPCHPSLPLLLFLLSWKKSPGQSPGCPWAHSGVGPCYPKWPHGRHHRSSLPRVMLVLNEEFSSVNGFGVRKTPEEEKGFGACLMLVLLKAVVRSSEEESSCRLFADTVDSVPSFLKSSFQRQ